MNGSTPILEPTELWRRITEMPRPSVVVDFPRAMPDGTPVGQLRIWVLTQEEQIAAASAAEKQTRDLLKRGGEMPRSDEARDGYDSVYSNCAACEVLLRACRTVEDPKRAFFPSVAQMRQHLSVDELGVLMNLYLEVQATVGPIISRLSNDEYEAWVELLAKGAAAFPLGRLSLQARSELTVRMASELWSFWMPSTSPGSPPEGGPTASDPADS